MMPRVPDESIGMMALERSERTGSSSNSNIINDESSHSVPLEIVANDDDNDALPAEVLAHVDTPTLSEADGNETESETDSDTETEPSTSEDEADVELAAVRDDITLSDSITDEIRRGVYTCLVCTGELDSESKIWSCHWCYRAYDLSCIRSWATKGSSTEADRSWRCPACSGKHHKIPKRYACWCGKVVNPMTNILNPHSCSSTCNHKLTTCEHGCSLSCHPGPHTKRCGAIGPVMSCYCGEQEQQLPCVMTPYENGWACGKTCDDLMPCGVHKCQKSCHSGLCGRCEEPIMGRCYCRKHEREMLCYERVPNSSTNEENESWIGVYQCDDICGHPLDCGNHTCSSVCHTQSSEAHKCPMNPVIASTCHCGKVPITDIIPGGRKSCLEPIPTCENICGKTLACGHQCIWNCHEGECSPCFMIFDTKCSCQYSQFSVSCKFLQDGNIPKCKHKCQALLNCRRHRCNRICCSDEPVAMKRERERAKLVRRAAISNNVDDSMNIEAVHICTRECGKLLSCGLHHCQRSCHVGACPPCLESSSEDLICSCGKTIVPAPVRCGTKLPPCPHPCPRQPACGHARIPHNCHEDENGCPKCTAQVAKVCQCHREIVVKNVMCFQDIVSCGNVCGLPLKCGHKCLKSCHKPGQCMAKCISKCGRKRACGHPDLEPCHYPRNECNEKLPCSTLIRLACACKRKMKEIPCGATATKASIKEDVLDCDEDCERLERNRVLFKALNIGGTKNSTSTISNHGLSSSTHFSDDAVAQLLELQNPYPKEILNIYYRQKNWCLGIEKTFRSVAFSSVTGKTTHHFAPMIQQQREFIHMLAEIYNFYSQSHDQEPKRSVMIMRTAQSKTPSMTLEEGYRCHQKLKEHEQAQRDKAANGVKELNKQHTNLADIYFNAILIQDIFFGVTRDQVEAALSDIIELHITASTALQKPITIDFMNASSYVFYSARHFETSPKLAEELEILCNMFRPLLREKNIAFGCKLCKLDESGTLVYEVDHRPLVKSSINTTEPEAVEGDDEEEEGILEIEADADGEATEVAAPAKSAIDNIKEDQWW